MLWAAQWLDEHREYAVTAIRLDDTADPDDEKDATTTLVLTLHRANEHQPGQLGPWPHGVPPLPCENFLYGFKAARRAARAANTARSPQLPLALPQRRRKTPVGWREKRSTDTGRVRLQATRATADLTREPSRRPSSGS